MISPPAIPKTDWSPTPVGRSEAKIAIPLRGQMDIRTPRCNRIDDRIVVCAANINAVPAGAGTSARRAAQREHTT